MKNKFLSLPLGQRIQIGVLGFLYLVFFLSFYHGEYLFAFRSGVAFLQGHFSDFYEYNNNELKIETLHFPPIYLISAIWEAPLYLLGLVKTEADVRNFMWWNKLMLLPFSFLAWWACHQIGQFIIDKKTDKIDAWTPSLLLVTSPFFIFLLVFYAGYDIVHVSISLAGLALIFKERFFYGVACFAIAAAFKNISLLLFIPVLLYWQKSVPKILLSLFIVMIPQALIKNLFRGSDVFSNTVISWDHLQRIFHPAISLSEVFPDRAGRPDIGLYLLMYTLICVFCFVWNPVKKSATDVIKISLVTAITFIGLIFWHPHWFILFPPFYLLIAHLSKRMNSVLILEGLMYFCFTAYCAFTWESVNYIITWDFLPILRDKIFGQKMYFDLYRVMFNFPNVKFQQLYYTLLVGIAISIGYLILRNNGDGEKPKLGNDLNIQFNHLILARLWLPILLYVGQTLYFYF